jgi:predicted Zn-dependent protease with MMP-like domain
MRLKRMEFDNLVKRAIRRIPQEIREQLANILISVQEEPSADILGDMGLPVGYPLLGVYQGASLTERSSTSPPLYPDTIFLFQKPLEDMCRSVEELEKQIEITVVHEVAHFMGLIEEKLIELGYE